jgi:hypothetical protein
MGELSCSVAVAAEPQGEAAVAAAVTTTATTAPTIPPAPAPAGGSQALRWRSQTTMTPRRPGGASGGTSPHQPPSPRQGCW